MKKGFNRFNKKNFNFNKGPKNLILGVIFFVLCLGLLTQLTQYTQNIKAIAYSTFLKYIEADQVSMIKSVGTDVEGELKNGEKFTVVVPENNQQMWDLLKAHNVDSVVGRPAMQLGFWQILLFMMFMFVIVPFVFWYFKQAKGSGGAGGGGIFSMGKSKAKMFLPSQIKDNFNSVAGLMEAKEELKDVVDFLKNPAKYKRLGAKITRGVLLVGEPGNGKTLLARAVAGEANCPFFSISGSDFIEVFVGVGASRVRDLFSQARKVAPSIIFIDEIDAVGRHRGSGMGGGHDEREQTLNQLLTEMDGFDQSGEPVIVMAATNRPDVLDKALLRPGRFDRRVEVPYPDLKCRQEILSVHAKNVKMDKSVDLEKIARGTPGFSGADLANLINESAIIASKAAKDLVDVDDIEEARDKILLGKELKSIILTDEDKKLTAYHEAGHTLMRLLHPDESHALHKVTIIPRGRALGVTHSLPEREKHNQTKEEILAHIEVALGGRIAEELVFDESSTGAYSDFLTATDLAQRMVKFYGMSDLGEVVYSSGTYSEGTATKIDDEVRLIIKKSYEKAKKSLIENRDKLDKLANALLEKETMYASEIYELLGMEPRKDFKLT
jgi:cell division protease FtsH